jgi:hypothetical protein
VVGDASRNAEVDEWFAVRCVFNLGPSGTSSGEQIERAYEERITLWRAASSDEAVQLAESEAEAYAHDIDAEFVGLSQSYELVDEPDHGAEVFSLIRESDLAPNDYLNAFFDTGSEYQRHVESD